MTPPISFPSASLIAIPHLGDAERTHDALVIDGLAGEARLVALVDTAFGTVGVILIPIVDMHLFRDRDATVAAAISGVELAARHGARCVSATGMIPAATRGLLAVQEALDPELQDIALTTGHETVTAAFILNAETLCQRVGRRLGDERMTFVGLGRIGGATLRLLLALGVRPPSIRLIDIDAKRAALDALASELAAEHDYDHFEVATVPPGSSVPLGVYDDTTLFMTATSAPEVLDVDQLGPGTLCVDDSFPLGFDSEKAAARIAGKGDVVFTIAGGIASDHPVTVRHLATGNSLLDTVGPAVERAAVVRARGLTGCMYSAATVPHFALPFSTGHVNPANAVEHFRRYREAGFGGTPIYIIRSKGAMEDVGAFFVGDAVLDAFRERYGTA